MRLKYAVVLWVWAVCLLAWAGKHLEPVTDWKGWIAVLWEFAKCAFLIRVGVILVDADQEIERL
jgi:hypothetical protein